MRKSDPTTKSNVIAFPKQQRKHPSATSVHPQRPLTRKPKRRQSKPSPEFRPPLHASTGDDVLHRHRQRIEILTMKGNPTPELIDEMAPGLVRNILRRAGPDYTGKAELTKHLKRRLDLMCRFKHPAALILKDWLDGNRRFLPANIQTIAEYSTCAEEQK
ncbi:hypothetical protein OEG84_23670 [Hoeflea sp. G2-23]|uniref:Uncharacterized protein n=1 Tax=Hoeflea algicola TaxID=2983763 RepID=A0ABT3ZDD7_9HYPH|nr:hypothetical protein [Hoeflea algicola]MCY0149314.1 hypothetical protein [Hoeflea algicola]MCY0150620.1 hypothetical protein [Hoeflea algicola]